MREYRKKMGEIGMKREWQVGDEWLRTQITTLLASIQERIDEQKRGADWYKDGNADAALETAIAIIEEAKKGI